jgi:hypothetical protein
LEAALGPLSGSGLPRLGFAGSDWKFWWLRFEAKTMKGKTIVLGSAEVMLVAWEHVTMLKAKGEKEPRYKVAR